MNVCDGRTEQTMKFPSRREASEYIDDVLSKGMLLRMTFRKIEEFENVILNRILKIWEGDTMIELKGQELQPGDVVKCKGMTCIIKDVAWQEPWNWRDSYYCEFTDVNGVYRSWKQCYDGGSVWRNEE